MLILQKFEVPKFEKDKRRNGSIFFFFNEHFNLYIH